MCVCVCVYMHACMLAYLNTWHSIHVKDRGKLVRVHSLLLQCQSQESDQTYVLRLGDKYLYLLLLLVLFKIIYNKSGNVLKV